ncbi:MAG: twin-arginine translocase TatA/TatE family subunit [Acidobacteria bacterium]|nr:twin-arginine translocase TatA/TatE family subunit [Acidobacteriota bacterium]NIM61122.1 twin-arginine translocase TatA/TatE family subunit [Acidobacteriota bacterium]NIO58712.1 twin-arginine translocase TatA/TatE family subunit [Acidobacteriota bacterium]NIQ29763.1 twin-arginine translocase TatA/TatE family subunit [Acidobacteriota bacterium]NIQ84483.1 twin-arginine translocase TatA/TatE family subunit [Acidobacteriota bacterium]
MFTSISGPELLMILILGLLLFGPRKLPQIGRTVGKAFSEFRRATTDFKMNLEREVESTEIKQAARDVEQTVRETDLSIARQLQFEPEKPGPDDDVDKQKP